MKKNTSIILSGAFCSSLIISNILAFKTWQFFGIILPAAVIMFPIVYILNDVIAEICDYKTSKLIIYTGFLMNLVAVIAYNIAIGLKPSIYFEGQEAFSLVLSNSLRTLIASFIAYLIGSMTNLMIMDKLKNKDGDKRLAYRCIISTVFGEGLDALCFISIAFIGTMDMKSLLTMIIGQACFKILYEIIAYPLTRTVILKVKGSEKNE